ncbi:unnamed protein product [Absidia cylindrospora]
MPVMVQIQKKVSKSWLRTILTQCCHVIGNDDRPVLLIFSVDPLPSDIKTMCRVSGSAPYAYDMSAPLFAQRIRLFCPDLVHHYLASEPSPPSIVALSSFFSDQHPSALASTFFSKNPFYSNLYLLAFRFCQRMDIDPEPTQCVVTKTTTTTECLSSQQQHRHNDHQQRRSILAIEANPVNHQSVESNRSKRQSIKSNPAKRRVSIGSNPVKRRQTVESIPKNISQPNAKKRQQPDRTTQRPPSPAPSPPQPLVSHPPPSTPIPEPGNSSSSNGSISPLETANIEQQEDDEDEEDQLVDDDEETPVNENEVHGERITSIKQHDQDVIVDYCKEQLELNKDWKTIYDEGYGKYFAYKNKESLRRCMQLYIPMEKQIVTRVSQHNMDDIATFCRDLLDQNIEWTNIFQMGKGKYFAYQNSYVLKRAYMKHLSSRKKK